MGSPDALYCVFHGNDGYQSELEIASSQLVVGKPYLVTNVKMHASSTYVSLEGENGYFNSAIFDLDHNTLVEWHFKRALMERISA